MKTFGEIDTFILDNIRGLLVGVLYIFSWLAMISGVFVFPVLFIAALISGDFLESLLLLITGLFLSYVIRAIMTLGKSHLLNKKNSFYNGD